MKPNELIQELAKLLSVSCCPGCSHEGEGDVLRRNSMDFGAYERRRVVALKLAAKAKGEAKP